MARVSKSLQSFQRTAGQLSRSAAQTGKNINKRQVEDALKLMTADGRISKADRAAAESFLCKAPLTRGAKDVLKDFVEAGTGRVDSHSMSPWATRLGGAETSAPAPRVDDTVGGAESYSPPSSPSVGGGESNYSYTPSYTPSYSYGGGE